MLELHIKQLRALDEWFQTPLGMAVAHEFIADLEPVIGHLRGETLLQLGHCGTNPWLNSLKYDRKWVASPFIIDQSINVQSSLSQIPLARNSVDCVIVPLTLEPFGPSFSLIDEIDRVLNPMGYVVFLCINPYSLWGAALKGGLLGCYSDNKVKLRTPFNLNRIFLQRGYRQNSLSNFCYIPPINNQRLIKKLSFLDEVGKMLWPVPSGFFCYIAQKYEFIRPTLIKKTVEQTISQEFKSPMQPALNS